MTRTPPLDYGDFVREFNWTRPSHGGDISAAARVFGITATAMSQRLRRAIKAGHNVQFTEYTTKERAS